MSSRRRAKAPPTSIFARTTALVGMATKVAAKEVGARIASAADSKLAARIGQAQEVVTALSQLRGAAMKAGQLLSIEGRDFLPPEVLKVFNSLQDSGSTIPPETVRKILARELGPAKVKRVTNLAEEPIAAASIGQVHRAEIAGETVALKVQFPGVARSIDSDIAVLAKLSQSLVKLTGKDIDLSDLMKELKSVLKQEVDYLREAEHLREYRRLLADAEGYRVPRVFDDYTTKHVLALEWIEGRRFQEWVESRPSTRDRERIAVLILDLYFREFFEWGLVQTDPNFGNFLVLERPLALGVLDFGATLQYSESFRRDYRGALREIHSGEPTRILSAAIDFGLLDPRESDETKALYREMMRVTFEPFSPEKQPFRFGDVDYSTRARDAVIRFSRAVKYTAPPKKIVFLHRKLGGVFNLLKTLDVEIDLVPYWQRVIRAAD